MTLAANRAALDAVFLTPRVLAGITACDPGSILVGCRSALPIAVAPMSYQRLVHPEGEIGLARAAREAGIPLALSMMSSCLLEEVAAVGGTLWFQLYLLRDRGQVSDLIQRAEEAGLPGPGADRGRAPDRAQAARHAQRVRVAGRDHRREPARRRGPPGPPALGGRLRRGGAHQPGLRPIAELGGRGMAAGIDPAATGAEGESSTPRMPVVPRSPGSAQWSCPTTAAASSMGRWRASPRCPGSARRWTAGARSCWTAGSGAVPTC